MLHAFLALVALLVGGRASEAVTINFETTAGATPSIGLEIGSQFQALGVVFSTSDAAPLVFNRYDDNTLTAWTLQAPNSGVNALLPGFDRGEWFAFLDNLDVPGRYIVADFTVPAQEVSVDLLDVDFGNGQEHYEVRAFGLTGALLGTIDILGSGINGGTGSPGTGDGIPTTVELSFAGAPISRVEIDALVWGGGGIDDLSFTPVPEPTTAVLLGLGLAGLAVRRRSLA